MSQMPDKPASTIAAASVARESERGEREMLIDLTKAMLTSHAGPIAKFQHSLTTMRHIMDGAPLPADASAVATNTLAELHNEWGNGIPNMAGFFYTGVTPERFDQYATNVAHFFTKDSQRFKHDRDTTPQNAMESLRTNIQKLKDWNVQYRSQLGAQASTFTAALSEAGHALDKMDMYGELMQDYARVVSARANAQGEGR